MFLFSIYSFVRSFARSFAPLCATRACITAVPRNGFSIHSFFAAQFIIWLSFCFCFSFTPRYIYSLYYRQRTDVMCVWSCVPADMHFRLCAVGMIDALIMKYENTYVNVLIHFHFFFYIFVLFSLDIFINMSRCLFQYTSQSHFPSNICWINKQ